MNQIAVKNERSKQILSILKEHGPLPSSTINQLIHPPIQPRQLRFAISRLIKKQLIDIRRVNFTRHIVRYYQISQDQAALKTVSILLACSPHDLDFTIFRYRDFLHNDGVSLLSAKLQKLFPEAEVIRDFALEKSEEALRILQYKKIHDDLKPDLILKFKSAAAKKDIWIAFELEKTRKDDRRLIRKLRTYAAKSHIDGVVYICDTKRIENALRSTFNNYVAGWARRIWNYKNNFILLGDANKIATDKIENLYRLDQKPASLKDWISKLCVIPFNERQDQHFQ